MNELQVFTNAEFGTIRTILIDDEPWVVGRDVATALGYSNPSKAVRDHVDEEDKGVNVLFTPGGQQGLTVINESGLYCLIMASKLPSAKRFKRWVTNEVLPAIRKTGGYSVVQPIPQEEDFVPRPITSDDYLNAAKILSSCRNERLPYVVSMLEKAGLNVEILAASRIQDLFPKPSRGNAKDPQTAKLLSVVRDDYGIGSKRIENVCGLNHVQIDRMRQGTSRYNAGRAKLIRDAIHSLLPDLDIDAILAECE